MAAIEQATLWDGDDDRSMTRLGDLAIGDTFATDLPPYAAKVIGRHETGAVLVHWRFGVIAYADASQCVQAHNPPRTEMFDLEMERMRDLARRMTIENLPRTYSR